MATDTHRVTIEFDLDGGSLGLRTHDHVANEFEAITLWALLHLGYSLDAITGLRAAVTDADANRR